jgi:integrase
MRLYHLSRTIYRTARAQNAFRNPSHFARNRLKSHALKAAGVWTIWRRFWRASGGRESATRYGGSFKTKREALERKKWILGELAAKRVPDVRALAEPAAVSPTFRAAAERWLASRLDDAAGTKIQHRTSVGRAVRALGSRQLDAIGADDVAAMVVELSAEGLKPGYLRKILQAAAMVFDFARINPNPVRDKLTVRLPRERKPEVSPPTAEHVRAVHALLPPRYRLPLLVLDASGMRLGELEQLTWGDVDEPRGRWRISAAVSKTSGARWVSVPPYCSPPCSSCARATTAPRSAASSRASAATGSAPRSRAPAPQAACRRSRPTICATGGSRCFTSAGCRGRGSANSSGSGASP